jgi:hypothetical protein
MGGVERTTEVVQLFDQFSIGGLGGGIRLHRDSAISRAFQIGDRLRRLIGAEVVEGQHLGWNLARLVFKRRGNATVERCAAGRAQVVRHHVADDIVGELVRNATCLI